MGYIVGSVDGRVTLRSNCFLDNEVSVSPILVKGGVAFEANNFGDNSSRAGSCEFLASSNIFESLNDFLKAETVECIPFSSNKCLGVSPPQHHQRDTDFKPHKPLDTSTPPSGIFSKSPAPRLTSILLGTLGWTVVLVTE